MVLSRDVIRWPRSFGIGESNGYKPTAATYKLLTKQESGVAKPTLYRAAPQFRRTNHVYVYRSCSEAVKANATDEQTRER